MKTSAIILLIAASFLTACVSPSERGAGASKVLTSVDCELHFSSTGLPNIHTIEYTITRDAKIRQVDDDWERKWFKKRTSARHLTLEGWQKFQKTLARLDVYRWKPTYSPRHMIYDGYGWKFRISDGTRTVESRGGNAGPSPDNPKETASYFDDRKTSADTILSAALDDLWKSSLR
jgi:hypothetical protein